MYKKIKIQIDGMHCKSCETLIKTEAETLKGVKKIEVDCLTGSGRVEFDDELISMQEIVAEISKLNYCVVSMLDEGETAISAEDKIAKQEKDLEKKSFFWGLAIPIIIGLLIGFLFLFRSLGGFEILGQLNEGQVSYGLIFLIGLLAGFHCIGMCGGLVLAYTTKGLNDENKKSFKPHFQYNLGRLISYTVIGGILGGIGSFFGVNPIFTGVIMLLAGFLMVLMGLSFIKSWPILEKIKLRTPQFIAKFLFKNKHTEKPKGPFIIGLLNGFMPCGPLQAMQLYALSTGYVLGGALSMATYALGTIPVMFGLGVLVSRLKADKAQKFVKLSGMLVIILGVLMFNRGLMSFGYDTSSIFSQKSGSDKTDPIKPGKDKKDFQTVNMAVTYYGYQPNVLSIKKGVPVRWVIDGKGISGCTSSIQISSLKIYKKLTKGENVIEFTPPEGVKEIKFSCGMSMVWGKFIIKD